MIVFYITIIHASHIDNTSIVKFKDFTVNETETFVYFFKTYVKRFIRPYYVKYSGGDELPQLIEKDGFIE